MKAFATTLLLGFLSVPAQALVLGEDFVYSYSSDPNITLRVNSALSGVSAAPTSGAYGISTDNAYFFNPITNLFNTPVKMSASVLEVDFKDPIRNFSVDTTTGTDVGLMFFIYDSNDQFVSKFYDLSTYSTQSAANNWTFESSRHALLNFDYDVGKIVLGGAASPHQIISVSVLVPEPNIAYLFIGGLLSMVGGRLFGARRLSISD